MTARGECHARCADDKATRTSGFEGHLKVSSLLRDNYVPHGLPASSPLAALYFGAALIAQRKPAAGDLESSASCEWILIVAEAYLHDAVFIERA